MTTSPLRQSPLLNTNYNSMNYSSAIKNSITPKRNVQNEINKFYNKTFFKTIKGED